MFQTILIDVRELCTLSKLNSFTSSGKILIVHRNVLIESKSLNFGRAYKKLAW